MKIKGIICALACLCFVALSGCGGNTSTTQKNETVSRQQEVTSKQQRIALTAENANQYFDFNCYCDNFNYEPGGLLEFSGDASVSCHISTVPKRNCSFENVCLSGTVELDGLFWDGGIGLNKNGAEVNGGREIKFYISPDGHGETTVRATLSMVLETVDLPTSIDFHITQASGYVLI